MILLESSSKVIETFDQLSFLPLTTVQGLLKAVQVNSRQLCFMLAIETFKVWLSHSIYKFVNELTMLLSKLLFQHCL